MLRDVDRASNPWGKPQADRTALGRRPRRARAAAGRAAARRPVLGRLRARVRRARAAGRASRRPSCCSTAGVDFAILGPREACTGDPARRMGDEYTYQRLARQNVETLNESKVTKIVTTCPHCFNTIGNEYADFGGRVRGRPPHRVPGGAGARRQAAARGRRPEDHLSRLVLPRAPQRRAVGAARAGGGVGQGGRDAAQRQAHLLLRRGRRAHVDGGARGRPDQRGARARGGRDRRGHAGRRRARSAR